MAGRRSPRFEEEEEAPWTPKTSIGRKVANHEISSINQVLESGKPIREYQIVNALLPNLTHETLEIKNTQRMTGNGRKMQFRAVVLVGDGDGHLGIGAGKADEVRPAISSGLRLAKRNIARVPLGCGSWECGCKARHTIPIRAVGKNGSVEIVLKPAPLGVGIVANATVRKVLHAAGVKDVWTFARGRTSSIYNMAMAVFNALDSLNNMKYYDDWETQGGSEQAGTGQQQVEGSETNAAALQEPEPASAAVASEPEEKAGEEKQETQEMQSKKKEKEHKHEGETPSTGAG